MPHVFGKHWTREALRQRTGDIAQLAGIARSVLDDGPARGTRVATLRTGSGLETDVLLDRCMDLGRTQFRGASLAFRSSVGEAHPAHFSATGTEWLRSFGGGMLATCGLSSVGSPSRDQGQDFPLHGGIGITPASNVAQHAEWQGDDYTFSITGTMRETSLFGPNLTLRRTIASKLGSNTLEIEDVVRNEGFHESPVMLLYHINVGFPLLDSGSTLIAASRKVTPRDADAESGLKNYASFETPTPGYREQVSYHEMAANRDGRVRVALVNSGLLDSAGPAGLVIDYPAAQLPRFVQWKNMGQGEYVCGLEPSNCLVGGRAAERAAGRLETLAPGAEKRIALKLTILNSAEQVQALRKELAEL